MLGCPFKGGGEEASDSYQRQKADCSTAREHNDSLHEPGAERWHGVSEHHLLVDGHDRPWEADAEEHVDAV